MTDSGRVLPMIHRKPGGFLEVASADWMRWHEIARVKDLGVVFHEDRPAHYAVKVWQTGGGHATRAFATREDASDWTAALFAAIEHERQQARELPSAFLDYGCTSRQHAERIALNQVATVSLEVIGGREREGAADPPVDHRPRGLTLRERVQGALHILFRSPRR